MKKQCIHCNGCGLVKKTKEELLCIKKHSSSYNCYLCCNSMRLGLYKECEKCYGSGEIVIKQQNTFGINN
tara:strand:- start:8492 stop:8701 length:210 start_codon:yes stop_codon:yes gene_type:complete